MIKTIYAPSISVIARPELDKPNIGQFLVDNGLDWETEDEDSAERLAEFAGRVCYMAFSEAQYTKGAAQYINNLLEQKHGSVLEHVNWSFVLEGVSRSLTHELIRHRAGMAYSQLSQRYVDETDVAFVCPPQYIGNEEQHQKWLQFVRGCSAEYSILVQSEQMRPELQYLSRRERRIQVRQAARSILPNCTETKLVVTANARALRWLLEARGSVFAEKEIRRLAVAWTILMKREAPSFFADFEIVATDDGINSVYVRNSKV